MLDASITAIHPAGFTIQIHLHNKGYDEVDATIHTLEQRGYRPSRRGECPPAVTAIHDDIGVDLEQPVVVPRFATTLGALCLAARVLVDGEPLDTTVPLQGLQRNDFVVERTAVDRRDGATVRAKCPCIHRVSIDLRFDGGVPADRYAHVAIRGVHGVGVCWTCPVLNPIVRRAGHPAPLSGVERRRLDTTGHSRYRR